MSFIPHTCDSLVFLFTGEENRDLSFTLPNQTVFSGPVLDSPTSLHTIHNLTDPCYVFLTIVTPPFNL